MATKWIRELTSATTGTNTGIPFALRAIVGFLVNALGFSLDSSSDPPTTGSGSWASAGGGNWTLTATGGDFTSYDVGGLVTIAGSTAQNNGSWTIVSVASRTSLVYYNPTVGATNGSGTWTSTGTGTWTSYNPGAGSNGAFSGTDKNFVDSTAGAFLAGHVGYWILIDGANAGWYKITGYVDANTVTIDYRSGATEYPPSDSGITWHLLQDGYFIPTRSGAYAQLTTPHANGWAIEFKYTNFAFHQVSIRVATDGNWAGSKILGPVYFGCADSKTNWFYLAAEDDGSALHVMTHQATDNRYNGAFVCNITPYDTGHTSDEKVSLWGNSGSSITDADNGNLNHNYDSKRVGNGYWWKEWAQAVRSVYMVASTYAGYANGLEKWSSREKNRRLSGSGSGTGDSFSKTGSTITLTDAGAAWVVSDVGKTIKISGATTSGNNGLFVITSRISGTQITYENASGATEAFAGTWAIADFQDVLVGTTVVRDENNTTAEYELVGRLQGHYGVRASIGNKTAFSDSAPHALDKFHMADGFAFDWPGVTPQH